MNKFYTILPAILAILSLPACGKDSSNSQAAKAETPSGPTLSDQLVSAELVRAWELQTNAQSTLAITGDGGFTLRETGCTVDGTIDSVSANPQSDCQAGIATCGVIHLTIAATTNCHGFTAGTPGTCRYETQGYQLTINCGAQNSDAQIFQWQ